MCRYNTSMTNEQTTKGNETMNNETNSIKLEWKRTKEFSGACGTIVSRTVDGVWELHKSYLSGHIAIYNRTTKKEFRFEQRSVSSEWGTQKSAKCFLNGNLDFVTRSTM